ncbi:Carboxylesterase [Xylaria sp. FL1777]|nr:Carboxylesterase [Xylaria sp. FL1777]
MRSSASAICWLAATAIFTSGGSTESKTLVLTQYGPIYTENITDSGVYVYKGIPFAAPPVGELRWRSPVAPTPWTDAFNASEALRHCYFAFTGPFNPPSTPSEDCLYLNVWTSAVVNNGSLPVMVWIHGGGFETDAATSYRYDGTLFAEQEVVFVSFNYRLGNLGYLARPDLDAEDPHKNSGNFGLQDMIFALSWVKNNIANFGGDPDNVLAFGESAGGHALGLLMASPLAQGLFNKVIMESGTWWDSEHGSLATFNESRKRGLVWGDLFGVGSTADDLRSLSVELVVKSSPWVPLTDPGFTAFAPSIDNYVITKAPGTVFAAGQQMKVPMIAGWNAREDTIFQSRALGHLTAATFDVNRDNFFTIRGPNTTNTIAGAAKFYAADSPATAESAAYLLVADLVIAEQTWEAAYLHSQLSGSLPTYVYHFTYTSAYNPIAGHSTELEFLFRTFYPEPEVDNLPYSNTPDADDYEIGEKMMTYWTNFAKTSNPNLPASNLDLPEWPLYNGTANLLLELGNTVRPTRNTEFDRFWFIRSLRDNGVLPPSWRTTFI